MRFIHLADLHFGKSIYGRSLLEDQKYWVDRFLEQAAAVKPQAVVIAGDVYDRSAPSGEAVQLLSAELRSISTGYKRKTYQDHIIHGARPGRSYTTWNRFFSRMNSSGSAQRAICRKTAAESQQRASIAEKLRISSRASKNTAMMSGR